MTICSQSFNIILTFIFQLRGINKKSKWHKRATHKFFNLFWALFDVFKLKNKGQKVCKKIHLNVLDLGSKIHSILCVKKHSFKCKWSRLVDHLKTVLFQMVKNKTADPSKTGRLCPVFKWLDYPKLLNI
jgi:hypothetical protein